MIPKRRHRRYCYWKLYLCFVTLVFFMFSQCLIVIIVESCARKMRKRQKVLRVRKKNLMRDISLPWSLSHTSFHSSCLLRFYKQVSMLMSWRHEQECGLLIPKGTLIFSLSQSRFYIFCVARVGFSHSYSNFTKWKNEKFSIRRRFEI